MDNEIRIPDRDDPHDFGLTMVAHDDYISFTMPDNAGVICTDRQGVQKLKDFLENWLDGQESRGQ